MNFIDWPYESVNLENYELIDLGVKYQPMESLELRGQIKNLFDKDYIEVYSYSTAGRAFTLGAAISL